MTDKALLRRSLDAVRTLREQVDELRARAEEPIAVVGLGCRFPGGADGPERFWELLRKGRDGVVDVPHDRWPVEGWYSSDRSEPGTSYTRRGGFLAEGAHAFDAGFFGITDAEARDMDPQHRLLLETSWQALESAGLLSGTTAERRVGVFVGVSGSENTLLPRSPREAGPYTATGSAISVAAGRVAHTFGLRGPALAVDTACSSSLLAVHLAVESLRRGECTAALAGGVSAMMSPAVMVALCRMEALAEDGKCKVFDAAADGYVRSEGSGMVALMRASDAAAVRAPVLALIRGSAVNHDGRTSGLTVPNGRAQRELIADAVAAAGVEPRTVDYLEAHGTGTSLGDPIEVRAAADVLCADRDPEAPLRIGAVKSNIGHLEAAAGVAGLIKTVLALRHGEIPGGLHLNKPNPRLGVDRLPVALCDRTATWPRRGDGRPRTAGVSSFGFSGTNVHVVLTEPDALPDARPSARPEVRSDARPDAEPARTAGPERPAHVFALSARDPEGLRESAARHGRWLATHPDATLADFCHTATARRAHFAHRAAFVTTSRDDLARRLAALAAGDGPEPATGRRQTAAAEAVGARDRAPAPPVAFLLDATAPAAERITETLYATHPGFRAHADRCTAELRPPSAESDAGHDAALAADVRTVACQIALVRTLADWGIAAGAVAGGAAPGDLAAAVLSGALDAPTAGALLAARHGAAAPPAAPPARPRALRLLHGPDAGEAGAEQAADPEFWLRPGAGVRPEAAAAALAAHGYDTLVHLGGPSARPAAGEIRGLPGADIWRELLDWLADRHVSGQDVDWSAVDDGYERARLDLPGQTFRRRAHRPDAAAFVAAPAASGPGAPVGALGLRQVASPLAQRQFTTAVSRAVLPELADTAGVLHVGYYQELLASAVRTGTGLRLDDLRFERALTLSRGQERTVHLAVGPADGDGWAEFSVHSRQTGDGSPEAEQPGDEGWHRHAAGRLRPDGGRAADPAEVRPLPAAARAEIRERCTVRFEGAEFYRQMAERGVPLGPSVEWVDEAWLGEGEVLARFRPPAAAETAAGRPDRELPVPAGMLDACVQLYALAAGPQLAERDLFMTARLGEVGFGAPAEGGLWCHVRLTAPVGDLLVGEHLLCAEDGAPVGWGRGTEIRVISPGAGTYETPADGVRDDAERQRWQGADGAAALRDLLTGMVAELLQLTPAEVPSSRPLAETGLDSLAALELRQRVRAETGVDLPVDLLIAGPSLDEVVERLAGSAAGDGPAAPRPYDVDGRLWLPVTPRDDADVRLFCLPYGGRGASLYRDWPAAADGGVDVVPVQLPGREERGDERCIVDADEAVDAVAQALKPYLDRPFAFYGHSMGALLAYRLAHRLGSEYGELLRHLFVGAFSAPTGGENPLGARLRSVTQRLGFEQMPEHEELARVRRAQPRLYDTALRAELGEHLAGKADVAMDGAGYSDLRVVQSYRHDVAEPPLRVPVTAFHGAGDPVVAEQDADGWRPLTVGGFELLVVPGDHFFVHGDQSGPRVLAEMAARLRQPVRA
ncbi:beta-ketoacyl synthase N-terminal-like domain-containing protein [Streptomyces sp. 184]|uniref:beta-ketoacyl synthase N-terminal-like domain-containing protein n=1 Tax=Streptomyces sp. 184 TaxID=1827526 RepID=UPI00389196B8